MSKLLMLMSLVKKVLKLNGILESQTTKDQAKIAFPLAILFLLFGFVIPEWGDPAMAGAAAVAFAPAIARFLLWRKGEDSDEVSIKLPDVEIFRAKHAGDIAWYTCIGTLYDAREEGYDLATDTNGREWDVHTGEPTGITYRLPNPAPAGMVTEFIEKLKKGNPDD